MGPFIYVLGHARRRRRQTSGALPTILALLWFALVVSYLVYGVAAVSDASARYNLRRPIARQLGTAVMIPLSKRHARRRDATMTKDSAHESVASAIELDNDNETAAGDAGVDEDEEYVEPTDYSKTNDPEDVKLPPRIGMPMWTYS